jgi:hypothetical protein
MSLNVQSEVGQLRQAIVHRPGLELARLTTPRRLVSIVTRARPRSGQWPCLTRAHGPGKTVDSYPPSEPAHPVRGRTVRAEHRDDLADTGDPSGVIGVHDQRVTNLGPQRAARASELFMVWRVRSRTQHHE